MTRRISAIDIGSNAIRMMVAEGSGSAGTPFRVLKKFRAPVRLGHDAFTTGVISEHNFDLALSTFEQFSETNKKWNVEKVRAVATSACREAKNAQALISLVQKNFGIKIEVIDGIEEGRLIHLAVQKELDLAGKNTMLIDVGGGSVEVTFSHGHKMMATKSFPMGTVRVLENLSKRKLHESQLGVIMGEFIPDLAAHIHKNADGIKTDFAIGTGGNLECMAQLKGQLLKKSPTTYVTLTELGEIIKALRGISVKDRIEKLKLRPDRADVIVPASLLIETILRQAEVEKIVIPNVGLRDGLIWSMLS